MIESFAYEIIKQEGIEEGLLRGLKRGMLEKAKESVLDALSIRFHNVPARLKETVNKIEEPDKLNFLHRQAILCESLSQFEEILSNA